MTSLPFAEYPNFFPKHVLINFIQSQNDNQEKKFYFLEVVKENREGEFARRG